MEAIRNIDRPEEIRSTKNRKDAAVEQIKHYIRVHQLSVGAQLPTVRKMSEHFGTTRDAVWRALRQLEQDHWLDVLPNRRYAISEKVYKQILGSLRLRAVFSGKRYIYFSGFRRLADALSRECHYHNLDLQIDLLPLETAPKKEIWDGCDLLLIDSDSSGPLLDTFDHFPCPVVGLDANFSDRYSANIVTDHHFGGRLAAEAMLKRGLRTAHVVYHAGSDNNPRVSPRIDGFRQAWLEGGRSEDSIFFVPIEWNRSSFEIALNVQAYLKRQSVAESYFVTDGRLATAFLEVLAYMNVGVPEAAKLIGYDGAQRGELSDPPMTTIQQDMERIAKYAVRRVRKIAEGKGGGATPERVAPLLIERDSF